MPPLNFPEYIFRLRNAGTKQELFDEVRKKWIVLTPEEWVRQHAVKWLVNEKKFPASLLAVEKSISVNGLNKRCDIVAWSHEMKPVLIVECKSPEVEITQEVFDQAARYNLTLGANLFLLTNGMKHFCCQADHSTANYIFLPELPSYSQLYSH
ncbi:MAG: type I restriction enzyme HsdR N-terminal domain-containing protein [Bacteroidetes bacterium]|nr:type I restriction enzyme HsdR N-terminal domain-containing protein [Bacteroidota bacterium]